MEPDNNPQPSPLVPSEMPDIEQMLLLLELIDISLLNSAFCRWERYRDVRMANGKSWRPFLKFIELMLINGLSDFEESLSKAEAALAKNEELKL